MSDHVIPIAPVSLDHITFTADQVTEEQFQSWLARNNIDRTIEAAYRANHKVLTEIKGSIAQRYQDELRAAAAFRHLATHGRIVKITCFGCGAKYQGWENKDPVCPACGTNNLDV